MRKRRSRRAFEPFLSFKLRNVFFPPGVKAEKHHSVVVDVVFSWFWRESISLLEICSPFFPGGGISKWRF